MRAVLAANGSQYFPGVLQTWWREDMTGNANAHHHRIKTFSDTNQTEDSKAAGVTTLMHGEDDQMVSIAPAV